ncbi:MAG: phosphotransferase [Clostridia bacterium]|nr:phosphotransferase [Clostridia bacterium]
MESVSKNKLTDEKIREITENAFPGCTLSASEEMTAGMCNALYKVTLSDGRKTVLKVSSPGMYGKATNEQWLMETEIAAMKLAETAGIRAPRVLFYDDTMTRCTGKYFFMEYAQGTLMSAMKDAPEETKKKLQFQMGEAVRKIGEIKNDKFGIVSSGITFDSLHGVVYQLISNVVGDLMRNDAELGVPGETILAQLRADKPYFDEVKTPSLVHFDIWQNNIIVQNGEIAAILDWERALWAEPLMEDRFRDYGMHPDYLAGFGQTEFSPNEQRRLIWYNIWINLAFMGERYTRGYMNEEQYSRVRERMLSHWNRLSA